MKTIGILGGMSSESTSIYYNWINREVNRLLGKNSGAKIIVYSFNFEDIVTLQKAGRWDLAGKELANGALKLQQAGADMVLIATNTMHKVADDVIAAIDVPLVNIIDETAKAIKEKGLSKVILLGTKFTMSDSFYRDGLAAHGIEALIPNEDEMNEIHRIIFGELCVNLISPESCKFYIDVINRLKKQGAQGVILGCTEICLLIDQEKVGDDLVVFDTTLIHSKAAIDLALKD